MDYKEIPAENVDERNPSFIPSTMGDKKVYTTYHMYLEQNYMRKVKHAFAKHLNAEEPSYLFEYPDEGEHKDQMVMHAAASPSHPIATASFGKDFAHSTLTLSDGGVVEIAPFKRTSTWQKTRVFRLDVQKEAASTQIPSGLFWEMGSRNHGKAGSGIGNYDLIDEHRKAYAVLITSFHKSMKKLGRLHFLVEPDQALVELTIGSLMTIWKKAEKDVRSGHLGLTGRK